MNFIFVNLCQYVVKYIRSFLIIRANKGSALIITLLIITVISAIGFGIGRLTIAEIKQSNRMEDSIAAESVAESGIEYGLLLYRYNHDVQLSKNCETPETCTVIPTKNSTADGGVTDAVRYDIGSDGNAKFELKIYYKAGEIGTDDNDFTNDPSIQQDQTIQLSGFKGEESPTIKYQVAADAKAQHGVEFRISNSDGSGSSYYIDQDHEWLFNSSGWSPPPESNFTEDSILRIKPWNTGINYTAEVDSGGGTIDSGTTTIESTGYYGNTKRKLVTTINRASGSLLGIFDFVLYSGTGNIELK